jgi:DNA-binding IclR family transcriptional regulator
MSSPKSTRRYAAPALTKGLRLLEVLATSPAPMTQSDLARALHKSPAEIFRMLNVLSSEGYIHRDTQGSYLPTLKLFALGRAVNPLSTLLVTAVGPMREFARLSGQECHLSVLDEGRLVVLAQESGTAAVSIRIIEGSQHNPLTTASGRLLLALLPGTEAERQIRLARGLFKASPPRTSVLRRELKRIAATGYSEARDESRAGLADTAVAVQGAGPWPHAALASSHFIAEIRGSRPKEILHHLRTAAESIVQSHQPCAVSPKQPTHATVKHGPRH